MGRIKRWLKSIVHIDQFEQHKNEYEARLQGVEARLQSVEVKSDDLEGQNVRRAEETRELSEVIGYIRSNIVDEISSRPDNLEELNRRLSISPTIWGNKDRLHISDKAAVFSGFFNTNSGEITVGDYSFCGSNVSFLTGSHDKNLTGLLRRDCEIKEDNDIIIGNGVWIASNVTIIGPCRIGDNAVVGAGAVVLPGTEIPANAVYAGVPARQISDISEATSKPMSIDNVAVQEAIDREGGVLFADGWSEKRTILRDGEEFECHYMVKEEAMIYSTLPELDLYYQKEDEACGYILDVDGKRYELNEKNGLIKIAVVDNICVVRNDMNNKLFLGVNK